MAVHAKSQPSQVQFANLVSCMQHSDFVRETIRKLMQTGAMRPWAGKAPPMLISGLGVVANRKGKLRLILDCKYLNLYLHCWKLKYERLADVTQYLQQDHWFVLTDLKSGYHHVPIHPDHWRIGIKFEGQVFAYTHMPFGEASAPGNFTTLMEEVCTPLRQLRQCLSSYLNDGLFAAASKGRCFFMAKTLVLLLTALGFFLSWDKCQLVPTQQGRFLGLLVDSATCRLKVPQDKVDYIKELIHASLQSTSATRRQLASIA